MILNAEALIGKYLRELPALKALKVRVLGETPPEADQEKPWIRLTLIDPQNATGINRVERLVSYYLQLDCYAGATGGQSEAFAVATAARSALVGLPDADPFAEAVVTDADPLSMPRIPDTDFAATRQRYVLDIEVWMHPR